jgi:hypothetical protein
MVPTEGIKIAIRQLKGAGLRVFALVLNLFTFEIRI